MDLAKQKQRNKQLADLYTKNEFCPTVSIQSHHLDHSSIDTFTTRRVTMSQLQHTYTLLCNKCIFIIIHYYAVSVYIYNYTILCNKYIYIIIHYYAISVYIIMHYYAISVSV